MISRHSLLRFAPFALALTLTACGQKGPLYLPDGDRPVKVERAPQAPDGNAPDRSTESRKQIH